MRWAIVAAAMLALASPAAAQDHESVGAAVRWAIEQGAAEGLGQLGRLVPAQREGLIACVGLAMEAMPAERQRTFLAERDLQDALNTITNFDLTVEGDPIAACVNGAMGR